MENASKKIKNNSVNTKFDSCLFADIMNMMYLGFFLQVQRHVDHTMEMCILGRWISTLDLNLIIHLFLNKAAPDFGVVSSRSFPFLCINAEKCIEFLRHQTRHDSREHLCVFPTGNWKIIF